jgi:hypothetical protein
MPCRKVSFVGTQETGLQSDVLLPHAQPAVLVIPAFRELGTRLDAPERLSPGSFRSETQVIFGHTSYHEFPRN